MRVVLDTNVLISAIFFSGPPATVLEARVDDRFELVVSADILKEYRAVARRIGVKHRGIDIEPVLDRIAMHALLVVPAAIPNDAWSDPDDLKFLGCAIASAATVVISGDRALLRASGFEGVEVLTPRQFLDRRLARTR
jgi:putative PIN family toxin of toxin-antitoxin system